MAVPNGFKLGALFSTGAVFCSFDSGFAPNRAGVAPRGLEGRPNSPELGGVEAENKGLGAGFDGSTGFEPKSGFPPPAAGTGGIPNRPLPPLVPPPILCFLLPGTGGIPKRPPLVAGLPSTFLLVPPNGVDVGSGSMRTPLKTEAGAGAALSAEESAAFAPKIVGGFEANGDVCCEGAPNKFNLGVFEPPAALPLPPPGDGEPNMVKV